MNINTKEVYSEVYQILNLLGNEYINKLPTKLFNMLEEKRETAYEPIYVEDIPLDEQNIKKETMSIITLLYLNYWCENENEKNEIKQILKNNEDKYQELLREKYNPDDIFKKDKEELNINTKEKALVEIKKQFFIKRLLEIIKHIFLKRLIM